MCLSFLYLKLNYFEILIYFYISFILYVNNLPNFIFCNLFLILLESYPESPNNILFEFG